MKNRRFLLPPFAATLFLGLLLASLRSQLPVSEGMDPKQGPGAPGVDGVGFTHVLTRELTGFYLGGRGRDGAGGRGGRGGDGGNGGSFHLRFAWGDVRALGGDGGDGGPGQDSGAGSRDGNGQGVAGGDGGDGGSVFLFPADPRKSHVEESPGRGGVGGRGVTPGPNGSNGSNGWHH